MTQPKTHPHSTSLRPLRPVTSQRLSAQPTPSRSGLRARSPRSGFPIRLHPPTRTAQALLDAIAWLGGAVLLRLLIEGFMVVSSQFWVLGVVMAIAPALMAIWIVMTSPQMGLVLGYRCLLVMVGLLIGGKLGGS